MDPLQRSSSSSWGSFAFRSFVSVVFFSSSFFLFFFLVCFYSVEIVCLPSSTIPLLILFGLLAFNIMNNYDDFVDCKYPREASIIFG